ncbi:DUF6538 domain-containing protein [Halorhodospira halophila]|uniref:DUF6538 domain-containing protein n=1 Tax=Halorhodospira halophila TaxID=1053 RepID=UPI001912C387|nr:DUF6538 domain-containing protein [Halorhodospira halophila]MBK5935535.1 hypothetical protein [Halorhodospira halophila]
MPRYLEKRRRRWYAVLEIPRELREFFGKARFRESLQTDSQRVAEQRVHGIVGPWKARLEAARMALASDCPHERVLAEYRQALEELGGYPTPRLEESSQPPVEVQTSEELEELGYTPDSECYRQDLLLDGIQEYAESRIAPYLGPAAAVEWYRRATGRAVDLAHLSEQWLASLSCVSKTITMHRQSLGLLLEHHRTAETINRRSASHFVDQILSADRAPATVKRMISTYRTFWNWMLDHGYLSESTKNPWERQGPSGRTSKGNNGSSGRSKRRGYSEDEGAQLLAIVDADRIKHPADPLAVRLLAVTGMRIEEVCSLHVADVSELTSASPVVHFSPT